MSNNNKAQQAEQARRVLEQRISFETAEKTYLNFLATAQRELSALIGDSFVWEGEPQVTDMSLCGSPFHRVDGAGRLYLRTGVGPAIPDHKWEAAVALIKQLAEPLGYRHLQVHRNGPGTHELSLLSDDDGSIDFGTVKATTLTVYSPCLLREHPLALTNPPIPTMPVQGSTR